MRYGIKWGLGVSVIGIKVSGEDKHEPQKERRYPRDNRRNLVKSNQMCPFGELEQSSLYEIVCGLKLKSM